MCGVTALLSIESIADLSCRYSCMSVNSGNLSCRVRSSVATSWIGLRHPLTVCLIDWKSSYNLSLYVGEIQNALNSLRNSISVLYWFVTLDLHFLSYSFAVPSTYPAAYANAT